MRHPRADTLDTMDEAFRVALDAAAVANRVNPNLSLVSEYPPVDFDPDCIASVREAASGLGLTHRDIVSGAGHDACHLAGFAPTGMIFVPCENGISHNEAETASAAHLAAGCDVLLAVVLRYALG